jgi:hypothetical protein
MPAWYKIDKAYNMVLSTGSGTVTATELLEHQRKLFADPDFDPSFSQLIDFTHVTELDATTDDFRLLANKSKFKHNARRAILVGTDKAFELSEVFRTLRENIGDRGIKSFRTLDDALDWLARATK